MKARLSTSFGISVGLLTALTFSFTVAAIYQEGNFLPSVLSFLFPVVALLCIYKDSGKRVLSALVAVMVISAATLLYLRLEEDAGPFVFLTVALVGIAVPIGVDLVFLDTGTRIVVRSAVARSTVITFVLFLVPLTALLVSSKHQEVVQEDQALIREVVQHVHPQENAIVFNHIDPKHKAQLKNRISVRAKGKTFQLADAQFESVSEERTVRTETEKRGAPKSLVVSRQREEQMRVVLDLEDVGVLDHITLFSTRGPLTICEQKVSLAEEEHDKGPIS